MSKALPSHAHHVAECCYIGHELMNAHSNYAVAILIFLMVAELAVWIVNHE